MKIPKLHSPWLRLFFFVAGVISTLAYRAIVVVNNYSHLWAQLLWYVGTIGFIIYFIHRYQISQNRAELLRKFKLPEKIESLPELTSEEKQAISYVFDTLQSSREKLNSIFIFVVSFLALILGLYLDFFKH